MNQLDGVSFLSSMLVLHCLGDSMLSFDALREININSKLMAVRAQL